MSEEAPAPAPKAPIPWRRWLPKAAFEATFVVLGLVLAFALQQWAEDRALDKRVRETRAYFVHELKSNRGMIEKALARHRRVRDAAGRARLAGADGQAELTAALGAGFGPVFPRQAVWESFRGDEQLMSRMKPEELFKLADVYRIQDELTYVNRQAYGEVVDATRAVYANEPLRLRAIGLGIYMGDVVAMEQYLVRAQTGLIETLEKPAKK